MSYRCLRASQAARRPPAPHWASTAGPRRGPAATGCAPAEGSPASYPPALVRTALLPRLLDAVRLRPVPLALPAAAAAAAAGSSAAAQRRRAAALHSAARIGAGSGSGTTCGPAVRTRGVCYVHTTAVSLSSSSAQQLRAAVKLHWLRHEQPVWVSPSTRALSLAEERALRRGEGARARQASARHSSAGIVLCGCGARVCCVPRLALRSVPAGGGDPASRQASPTGRSRGSPPQRAERVGEGTRVPGGARPAGRAQRASDSSAGASQQR